MPMIISIIKKFRSNGLPYSPSLTEYENQTAKGLLAIRRIQIVGSHRAKEQFGALLRSSVRSQKTKHVQSMSAIIGGMGSTFISSWLKVYKSRIFNIIMNARRPAHLIILFSFNNLYYFFCQFDILFRCEMGIGSQVYFGIIRRAYDMRT